MRLPNEYRVEGTAPELGVERSVQIPVAMSYECRSLRREPTAHTHRHTRSQHHRSLKCHRT
eukprot:3489273-Rhodomonas_salina.4